MVEHGVGKKHMGKKLVKLIIFCCCRLKERPESPIFTYVRVFRVFSFFFWWGGLLLRVARVACSVAER